MKRDKLPQYILLNVRRNLGLDDNDTSRDKEILQWNDEEILERYLRWRCIIGYGSEIYKVVKDIMKSHKNRKSKNVAKISN